MGHRINYAIKENGRVTLFYSHWGSLTTAQDIFWGPEYTERFIRSNKEVPNDQWLDDVWGEGGVALDKDTKSMAFFSETGLDDPQTRPIFDILLQAVWSAAAWTVSRVKSMPDIAEHVGFERAVATAEPIPPTTYSVRQSAERYKNDAYLCGLLSFSEDGKTWDDRIASYTVGGILVGGPHLWDEREELPNLQQALSHFESPGEEPDLTLGNKFHSGALICKRTRTIDYWESDWHIEEYVPHLNRLWPGWTLRTYLGIEEHFERSGRTLPASLKPQALDAFANAFGEAESETYSDEEILGEIGSVLLGDDRPDPSQTIQKLVAEFEAESKDFWIHPEAMKSPSALKPSPETCRKIWESALLHWYRQVAEPEKQTP